MSEQVHERQAVEPRTPQRDLWWWALRLVVGGSGLAILISLFDDARGRWDDWNQGDWLINDINGPIRRGPTGTMIIHLADWLGVNPVTAVVLVQTVLAVVLYAAYYRVVTSLPDARLALLLSVSPALWVLMWPANLYQGALRKELIGFTAVALLLWHLRDRRTWSAVAALVLMTVGVWAHEVVVLFVPLVGYLLWLAVKDAGRTRRVVLGILAAVLVVSAGLAAIYALQHTEIARWKVRNPLRAAGVESRMFDGDGALSWVDAGPARASKSLHYRDLNPTGLVNFALMLAFSLAAPLYLAWQLQKRRIAVVAAAAAVPFLPLFAIVSDWGRWLSLCVFAFVAVVLAEAVTKGVALRRTPVPAVALTGFLLVGLLLPPDHINGIHWGGVVTRAPRLLHEFAQVLF
jgi:hypothetical protein